MIDHEEARLLLADLLIPGLSDPSRSAALRAHVSVCSRCQGELGELRQLDTRLRDAGPMPYPSDELTRRVLSITAERRVDPAPEPARPRRLWESITLWRVGTVAFAAATLVVLGIALSRGASASNVDAVRAPVQLRVAASWQASGHAQLVSVGGTRSLHVRIDGLPPATGGGYYELWLARSPADRVSLGSFQPDRVGRIDAVVSLPEVTGNYRGVWLTREPNDNDPRWSNDWVVAGRFT